MSANTDVITLSSDEEDHTPPKKRVKLITIDTNLKQPSLKAFLKPDSYIVLSDEEDERAVERNTLRAVISPTGSDIKIESTAKLLVDEKITNKTINADEIQNDPNSNIINIEEDEIKSPQDISVVNVDEKNIQDASEPVIINDAHLLRSGSAKNDTTKNSIEINCLSNCDEEDEMIEKVDKTAEEFYVFLDDCLQSLTDSEHKQLLHSKLPIIKKFFEKNKHYSFDEDGFSDIIKRLSKRVSDNPKETVICFSEAYQWLKLSYINSKKEQATIVKNRKMTRKLNKTLIKLKARIRELESAEIDFDDEEDSSYLQLERYSARAAKVHKELCKYTDENPYQGRLTYLRLDFSHSKYTEINRAINKKYKSNQHFPTYFDLDKLIRKCVQEHNLTLSESMLQYEIKYCFEKLGKLLQNRRKLDSYQFLQDFLDDPTDPAKDNPEVEEKIKTNQNTYSKRLDDIFEKYSKLQETGYEPTLSSDSDDSCYAESDSEEKIEEVTAN